MIDIQTIFRERRGLKKQVADNLCITHGAVSQWTRVPAERVLDVERITGVSRHSLRPDLYPHEAKLSTTQISQDGGVPSSRNPAAIAEGTA